MDEAPLFALLPPAERLALAYAPGLARRATLAFLALDARLAAIVRGVREPVLAQVRLAWWRDRLHQDPQDWPVGEPLLAALADWGSGAARLAAVVDGWEELVGEPPLPHAAFARFASGRAAGWRGLAELIGADVSTAKIETVARGWALADLAMHLTDPKERQTVGALIAEQSWQRVRLPRGLRSLAVLYALARRSRGHHAMLSGPGALVTVLRVGFGGG